MLTLPDALKAWKTPDFDRVLKGEIQKINIAYLPLQAGLSQTSYVCETEINVLILNISETADSVRVKTGVFYAGIIAGSCCADDPTPVCEQTEYCELLFDIAKSTAQTTVTLLKDQ